MRPHPFRLPVFLIAALLAAAPGGCSDDSGTPAPDAAVADRGTASDGPSTTAEASAPDQAKADLARPDGPATAGDTGPADGAALGDMVGPPPSSLPSNITQFVNLGDSLAYGYPASTGLSYKELLLRNADATYPSWKGKDLSTRFPGVTPVDRGTVGALSSDLSKQVATLKGNPKGDTLVVISIGGNDFAGSILGLALNPAGAKNLAVAVTQNIAKALTHFANKKLYPNKVAVVLFNVFDPTDGAGTIPGQKGLSGFCTVIQLAGPLVGKGILGGLVTFNKEMASFAHKAGIMLADHHAAFLGHGYNYKDNKNKYYNAADPTLWFHNDCIHANDRGYHEMRKVVYNRITGGK